MDSWTEKFKEYVPAEILAAFITINSLVPYKQGFDLYIMPAAVLVLVAFYLIHTIKAYPKMPRMLMIAVALSLPLWCILIAVERIDNYIDAKNLKIVLSVFLVLLSLGLTLFVRRPEQS